MGRRHYVPLRRRHDIPIRRREDVPLRRLGDVPLRRCWVFHLRRTCDVAGTYRETSLRRCYDVLLPGGKECIVCHYWFFNHGFKFQDPLCNGCNDLTMLCLNLIDIAIITIENVDYRCIIHNISKSDVIHLLENSVLDDREYQ